MDRRTFLKTVFSAALLSQGIKPVAQPFRLSASNNIASITLSGTGASEIATFAGDVQVESTFCFDRVLTWGEIETLYYHEGPKYEVRRLITYRLFS